MNGEHDPELTRAFVRIFESIAVARGLLSAANDRDGVQLLDDAVRRATAAMRRSRASSVTAGGRSP